MNENDNILHENEDGQLSLFEEDEVKENSNDTEDPLKEAIEEQLKKIRRQNILIGAQTACHVVLQKIVTTKNKPGKRTMADYKRLIKDIEQFCLTGISRKVNADGETEPIEKESTAEETVQN